jgi:hypothetical protein
MPHRRPVRKGSFGGRLDDLVEHFPDRESGRQRGKQRSKAGQHDTDDRHINERLFGRAWDKRRGDQDRRFSNQ